MIENILEQSEDSFRKTYREGREVLFNHLGLVRVGKIKSSLFETKVICVELFPTDIGDYDRAIIWIHSEDVWLVRKTDNG